MKFKIYYHPFHNLIGINVFENYIKVQDSGRVFMVKTKDWELIGQL
jgi:hypothetical protein